MRRAGYKLCIQIGLNYKEKGHALTGMNHPTRTDIFNIRSTRYSSKYPTVEDRNIPLSVADREALTMAYGRDNNDEEDT